MKSTSGWKDNGNATNSSGFSGLPGGSRDYSGSFNDIVYYGSWWSSTEYNTGDAWNRDLINDSGYASRYYDYEENGLSVRCLRD